MGNLAVIRGLYEAFAAGDLPAVLAVLDPEIVWTEAAGFPLAGTYHGPDAVVAEVFGPLMTDWEGWSATPHTYVDGGETIVALGTYSGTYRSTGKAMTTEFVHVWDMRDGQAVRFRQVADTALVQAALT